ncbi:MAG: ATP-binding protein [Methanobrevibacter sp.]|jgi:hypothetical protein|nr:ATP-binding protein [Candidatus Methanoflexus mossambicus]
MGKLKLKINDFGLINNAEINIGKINIISGVNSSGKSTASKILYSFLFSLTKEAIDFDNIEIDQIWRDLDSFLRFNNYSNENFLKDYLSLQKIVKNDAINNFFNIDSFKKFLEKYENYVNNSKKLKSLVNSLVFRLELINDLNNRRSFLFEKTLENEFKHECFYGEKSSLSLCNSEGGFTVDFKSNDSPNKLKSKYSNFAFPVFNVFYLETPFIFEITEGWTNPIDEYLGGSFPYHYISLISKLHRNTNFKKQIFNYNTIQNNDNPIDVIQNIMNGKIIYDNNHYKFIYETDNSNQYNINNIALGIKSIGILQSLLIDGLDNNSFIIMDEPEVHLHPSWQVDLAHAIVLLSKYENINFYINSHSPQFIEAIDVFSEKYELENETNFYYTVKLKGSNKFDFIELDHGELEILYQDLSKSYNEIDEVRAENFAKKF